MPMARAPIPKIVGLLKLDRIVRPWACALPEPRNASASPRSGQSPGRASKSRSQAVPPASRDWSLTPSVSPSLSSFGLSWSGLSFFLSPPWFGRGGGGAEACGGVGLGGVLAQRLLGPLRAVGARGPEPSELPDSLGLRAHRGRGRPPAASGGGIVDRRAARNPARAHAAPASHVPLVVPGGDPGPGPAARAPRPPAPGGAGRRDRSREATTVGRSRGNTRNWCSRRDQVREAGRTPRNGRRRNPNSGSRRRGCQRR